MGEGEVAVGLDAAAEPGKRFDALVELNLGYADPQQPPEGEYVGGREAKRFSDVSLGLLGSAEEILAKTDPAVSVSQIAVKCERLLAFGDTLSHAARKNLHGTQIEVSPRMPNALTKAVSAAASGTARWSVAKLAPSLRSITAPPTRASM